MDRVVLLSDVSPEFANNTPDAFKVRLAEPLALEGDWEVGLLSLSIPDSGRALAHVTGVENDVMFLFSYTLLGALDVQTLRQFTITGSNLQEEQFIKDGVDLMTSMIRNFEREAFMQTQALGLRMEKARRPSFHWEGPSLVAEHKALANIKLQHPMTDPGIRFMVNKKLAVGMGWLKPDFSKLGENLHYSLPFDDSTQTFTAVKETELGVKDLWETDEGYLYLSLTVNWHFVNLDEAFADYVGSTGRRYFVYTDLVESNRISGQLHPLIRGAHFPRSGEGVQYFEPLHVQWVPLRQPWMDIVEVQLADPTGTLAKMKKGQTVATFSFRKVTV